MSAIKAMVLFAPGTNCDEETVFCLETAGARTDRVLVRDLLDNKIDYRDYQILALPGGFSYGDCIAAGRILANHLGTILKDVVLDFQQSEKLVVGICNGFQVPVRLGLFDTARGPVTLEQNESTKFECRWVNLAAESECRTPFLDGIESLWLPAAHAEGRIVASRDTLDDLTAAKQVALRYKAHIEGREATYPENPNGSLEHIAGLTDTTGRIFGLMPHPERFFTQELFYARGKAGAGGDAGPGSGLRVFENAVRYLS